MNPLTPVPTMKHAPRRIRHLAIALLPLALLAATLPAAAANLGQILELAKRHDATYAAAREALRAGEEKAEQGRALMRPSVGLTGSVKHVNEHALQRDDRSDYKTSTVALQLTQPIMRQQNVVSRAQGELQARLAAEQFQQAEQDLLLRTARAYFEVLQAQDVLAAIGSQLQAFGEQLAQAKRGFELGSAPITDVNEAQSRHDLTRAQQIAAENDLAVKRRALQRIIQQEVPPLAPLDGAARVQAPPPGELAADVDRALNDSAAVRIARTNQEIAEREAEKQRYGHNPTVDLVLGLNDNRNSGTPGALVRTDARQATIGVEFSLPLYQGGAISSREREAAANLSRAGFELDAARRQSEFEARQAMLGAMSGSALVTALEQALTSGQTQVRSTRRGFELGLRARVDVLNAEQQLFATQRDLAAARYQTLVAALQLKAAANTLGEADLRALDALLKE